jgi:hypothetical protein
MPSSHSTEGTSLPPRSQSPAAAAHWTEDNRLQSDSQPEAAVAARLQPRSQPEAAVAAHLLPRSQPQAAEVTHLEPRSQPEVTVAAVGAGASRGERSGTDGDGHSSDYALFANHANAANASLSQRQLSIGHKVQRQPAIGPFGADLHASPGSIHIGRDPGVLSPVNCFITVAKPTRP